MTAAHHLPVLTSVDRERLAELRARDEFFWLDLVAPSDDDLVDLGELFGLHELAVEDTQHFGQRPKLEEYGDHTFVVFHGAQLVGDQPTLVEVHVFVHGGYLLTIRREGCPELDGLRDRFGRIERGVEAFVVYRVLDALTDSFFPVLSALDDEIDQLEDAVVAAPSPEHLHRIFELKRALGMLRKVVAPQRDLLARTADRLLDVPGLEMDARDYFRDVYDHMLRIADMVDTCRDLLASTVDMYMSTVANRQAEEMRKLTVIATIFLPLSFVVGFFGQNFGWMVDHVASGRAFVGYGLGGMALCLAVLATYLTRRRYW